MSVTSFACNLARILHNLLFLRANRESRVTATTSISPLRAARSMENKPGRQKELAFAHSQLCPTIQYPLQLAHSRSSSSCCSAADRCPLPVRAYNQTRGKKSTSSFFAFHLTPPNRNSEEPSSVGPPARSNRTGHRKCAHHTAAKMRATLPVRVGHNVNG